MASNLFLFFLLRFFIKPMSKSEGLKDFSDSSSRGNRGIKSSQLWKWKESMMRVAQRCMDALTNEDAILLCLG